MPRQRSWQPALAHEDKKLAQRLAAEMEKQDPLRVDAPGSADVIRAGLKLLAAKLGVEA